MSGQPTVRARSFRVRLGKEDCVRLYDVARARGVLPESLIEALVRIVLRESLVEAVIDDDTVLPPLPREHAL